MNDTRVFEEGYKEGWRLIKGPDVSGLTVPACELTGCCSPYREGLTRGMEDAARHQSERSNRDAPQPDTCGGLTVNHADITDS